MAGAESGVMILGPGRWTAGSHAEIWEDERRSSLAVGWLEI